MLPHFEHPLSDRLHVPKLAVLRFFQAASKAAMRQPILEAKQPSPKFFGVFDRKHNLNCNQTVTDCQPCWPVRTPPRQGSCRHSNAYQSQMRCRPAIDCGAQSPSRDSKRKTRLPDFVARSQFAQPHHASQKVGWQTLIAFLLVYSSVFTRLI